MLVNKKCSSSLDLCFMLLFYRFLRRRYQPVFPKFGEFFVIVGSYGNPFPILLIVFTFFTFHHSILKKCLAIFIFPFYANYDLIIRSQHLCLFFGVINCILTIFLILACLCLFLIMFVKAL